MDEIRVLGWTRRDGLMDELSALGCKPRLHASLIRGFRISLRGLSAYSPAFIQKVTEAFIRHGYRETAEGLWVKDGLTDDEIRRGVEELAEDDEYKEIYETMTAHPEWSDAEVAEACGVDVDYVAGFRSELDQ
jgi:hypothetical protein